MTRKVAVSEILRHHTANDAWIVVNGEVFDVTAFAPEHPGGSKIIYQYAGRDSSRPYNEIHSPSLIKTSLPAECHIGSLDESTISANWKRRDGETIHVAQKPTEFVRLELDNIINLGDFEKAANKTLTAKAWAFIHGGSNDSITRDANSEFLRRMWLRPAVMRHIGQANARTKLFSCEMDVPVFTSPTGAARMGGAEGELTLARAAAETGIIHCFATPSSYPHQEILNATRVGAFFQLYVNRERKQSEKLIREALSTGKIRAILMTVDVPAIPKRDEDERVTSPGPIVVSGIENADDTKSRDEKGSGTARLTSSFVDSKIGWNDIRWLRSVAGHTPIVIKGIQRAADALLAMEMGCDGVVISNHGGRAADYAPPAILTLLEINKCCPQVPEVMEVLIDGGFRRGSGIVKAICLGAAAVGIGRPFLYALGYGQKGVEHAVALIKDEIETTMSLCGMSDLIRDAHPDFVNTNDIDHLVPEMKHPYAKKIKKRQSRI